MSQFLDLWYSFCNLIALSLITLPDIFLWPGKCEILSGRLDYFLDKEFRYWHLLTGGDQFIMKNSRQFLNATSVACTTTKDIPGVNSKIPGKANMKATRQGRKTIGEFGHHLDSVSWLLPFGVIFLSRGLLLSVPVSLSLSRYIYISLTSWISH